MSSSSMLGALVNHAPDSFREMLRYFLHPRDCAALSCVDKTMHSFVAEDNLWEHHCSFSIVGLRNHLTRAQIQYTKHLLMIDSYRDMYILLRDLKFSLFGWFRLVHSGQHPLLNGGLYCIRVVGGRVVCQQINCFGDVVLGNDSYTLRFDAMKRCITATSVMAPIEYAVDMDSALRMHIKGDLGQVNQQQQQQQQQQLQLLQQQQLAVQYFTMQRRNVRTVDIADFVVMNPLPFATNFSAPPFGLQPYLGFRNCVGMFTAPYGSHGIEILHLSLHPAQDSLPAAPQSNASANALFEYVNKFNSYITNGVDTQKGINSIANSSSSGSSSSDTTMTMTHDNDNSGSGNTFHGLELRGLKVTGDPNVPAGKLSFVVNLQKQVNIDHELANDQRFIVVFPHESSTPTLMSLEQRRHNIMLWARGHGQVNRNPSDWRPEWVGCSFIMYKSPLTAGGATFSLVWDDEMDPYFRHAMDFQPMPRGNAPTYADSITSLLPSS